MRFSAVQMRTTRINFGRFCITHRLFVCYKLQRQLFSFIAVHKKFFVFASMRGLKLAYLGNYSIWIEKVELAIRPWI